MKDFTVLLLCLTMASGTLPGTIVRYKKEKDSGASLLPEILV